MFCPSWKRIAWNCAIVLISVIALASDGSKITNFSLSVPDSFGRVVVLVSLTATSSVRPSLTSQHLTGLFELHVVVHVAIVCKMEYGGCSSFCSDRHPVQVVSGPNKCSVSLLRVGFVAAVSVCSCRLVL